MMHTPKLAVYFINTISYAGNGKKDKNIFIKSLYSKYVIWVHVTFNSEAYCEVK